MVNTSSEPQPGAPVARARRAMSAAEADRVAALIDRVGPRPPIADLSAAACVAATARDKKVLAGTLHFVLPTGIGPVP